MKSHVHRLILTLACLMASGPALANTADAQRLTITGTVVDGATRSPIHDASVILLGDSGRVETSTDKEGRFVFKELLPGGYRVSAFKDGFAKYDPHHSKRISLARDAQSIDFLMNKEATISGRVLSPDHLPVADQRISLWERGFQNGHASLRSQGYATSNDLGEYRFASVRAGRYYLISSPELLAISTAFENSVPQPATPVKSKVATFYPNGTSPDEAQALNVRTGEDVTNIDISMRVVNTFCLTAKFPKSSGLNSAPMALTLAQRIEEIPLSIATASLPYPEKVRICGMPAGSYALRGVTPRKTLIQQSFEVGNRDVNAGLITDDPGFKVTGSVSIDGRDRVTPDRANGNSLAETTVSLEPLNRYLFAEERAHASPDSDGRFTLDYIFGDLFWIKVSGLPASYYVAKIRSSSGEDATANPIHIAGPAHLDVLLKTDGAQLAGKLLSPDQTPMEGARAILAPAEIPREMSPNDLLVTDSDDNGGFKMSNIRPGKYLLWAVYAEDVMTYQDPVFLNAHQSEAKEITLAPQDAVSVVLQVHPSAF